MCPRHIVPLHSITSIMHAKIEQLTNGSTETNTIQPSIATITPVHTFLFREPILSGHWMEMFATIPMVWPN